MKVFCPPAFAEAATRRQARMNATNRANPDFIGAASHMLDPAL
jgi:hypothetical protein